MRLLNTTTLQLELYDPSNVPEYAILSHTWGAKEITYQDLVGRDDRPRGSREWEKVHSSCKVADLKGYTHLWIDSCCIDKSSSAELSEAINSMFRWYARAEMCIAYLEDVNLSGTNMLWRVSQPPVQLLPILIPSRWFQRGWTLQELIAPKEIHFYDRSWTMFGTRTTLSMPIESISGVPVHDLHSAHFGKGSHETVTMDRLGQYSVAQRMNWAAARQTTRPEDRAYSLMGLFNIHMPLLYGEGGPRAFRRLQEEIIRSTVDETIYFWIEPGVVVKYGYHGLLASHPSAFGHHQCRNATRPRFMSRRERNVTTLTGDGLQLRLLRTPCPLQNTQDVYLVVLSCDLINPRQPHEERTSPVLILQRTSSWDDSEFVRIRPEVPLRVSRNKLVWPENIKLPDNFMLALEEPALHQMYVPHGSPYLHHPRGFLFAQPNLGHPRGQFERLLGPWYERSVLMELELRFEDSPEFPRTWERTVVLGGLKPSSDATYESGMSFPCIMVGMSPLADNGLGTKPFFREVWAAFETWTHAMGGHCPNLQERTSRDRNNQLARPLNVRLELESRHSRMYYRIHVSSDSNSPVDVGVSSTGEQ